MEGKDKTKKKEKKYRREMNGKQNCITRNERIQERKKKQ